MVGGNLYKHGNYGFLQWCVLDHVVIVVIEEALCKKGLSLEVTSVT